MLAAGLLFTALLAAYIDRYVQTEEALHQSEQRSHRQLLELETLYRTAPIGLALVDCDLRFLRINEKLVEIDGVPVDAHIGRTLREVVPGVADTVEPLYRRVIETGKPVTSFEIHGTTPAQPGVERDWLVDYYPLKAPDGSVQAVGAIVVEITERKRAEEELFKEKERAQITLASIGDGVITVDAAGRVESFNPVAAQLLGWSHSEAQGLSLTKSFPSSTKPAASGWRIRCRAVYAWANLRVLAIPSSDPPRRQGTRHRRRGRTDSRSRRQGGRCGHDLPGCHRTAPASPTAHLPSHR